MSHISRESTIKKKVIEGGAVCLPAFPGTRELQVSHPVQSSLDEALLPHIILIPVLPLLPGLQRLNEQVFVDQM